MKRWLEWDISYKQDGGYLYICLIEKSQKEGEKEGENPFEVSRWPTVRTVDSTILRLLTGTFIMRRMNLQEINVAVAKVKDRMFRRYKKSIGFSDTLHKLCEEWSTPRYLVDDPKVHEMVKTLGGAKST
jgi:hypothetical protein